MKASVNNNVSILFIVRCIKVLIGEPIQEESIYGKFIICAQFLWKPKTAFKNKVYIFFNTRIKPEKTGGKDFTSKCEGNSGYFHGI